MTHTGPFQPLPFCDSVILWCRVGRKSSKSQVAKTSSMSQQVPELTRPLGSTLAPPKTTTKGLCRSPAQHDAARLMFALKEFRRSCSGFAKKLPNCFGGRDGREAAELYPRHGGRHATAPRRPQAGPGLSVAAARFRRSSNRREVDCVFVLLEGSNKPRSPTHT